MSCFPGSVGRDVVFLSALPRSSWTGYRKGQALGGALLPSLSKGNQTFGWQGHYFHICSFRRLCCYSTHCDLGCPLPSAKALSLRPGRHLVIMEPSGEWVLFLPLQRLGQAAGVAFLHRQGSGWIWESMPFSEMDIWSSFDAHQEFTLLDHQ